MRSSMQDGEFPVLFLSYGKKKKNDMDHAIELKRLCKVMPALCLMFARTSR